MQAFAYLLTLELFLNHIAISTVATDLNDDLAKLVNGEMTGQLGCKERQGLLQLTGCIHATCGQITVGKLQESTDDPSNPTWALTGLAVAWALTKLGM
jgi:hypothetical protein